MDFNSINPSLLTIKRPSSPAPWPVPHPIPNIAESINRLRRLPIQIGGVTIASEYEQHSFTSPSSNKAFYQDGNFQPLSLDVSHVSNYNTIDEFQAANLPQTRSAHSQRISHHEYFNRDSSHLAQTRGKQTLNRSQINTTVLQSTRLYPHTVIEFPKIHCGEFGCRIFRTDGNNHSGRYAMSAHYKKKHPELRFDVTKLISSTTGQKNRRMSLKKDDDHFKIMKDFNSVIEDSSKVFHDEAVRPTILSVPAQTSPTQTQRQIAIANSLSLANSPPNVPQDQAPYRNHNAAVHTSSPQLYPHLAMPKLPRIRPVSFTDVYDLHVSPDSFKTQIRDLRADCDTEFFTVRRLILTYTRATNQSDTAFQSIRKTESTRSLQKMHSFVTKAIGPSDLDARGVGLGLRGDTVTEYAVIITAGLERVHLPADGILPDGTVLGTEEMQRRFSCCELQATKLCLFAFRGLVRIWTEKVQSIARGHAASVLLENIKNGNMDDCQMLDC